MNHRTQREQKDPQHKTTLREVWQAFSEYLGRPKTVFDFKDRSKMLLIIITAIILLQKVVQILSD